MLIPIDANHVINLDAPVVSAYEVEVSDVPHWIVWCKHCGVWHQHSAGAGLRQAHCVNEHSPYLRHGYNLAYAGAWSDVLRHQEIIGQ